MVKLNPFDLGIVFGREVSPEKQKDFISALGALQVVKGEDYHGNTIIMLDGVNETSVTTAMRNAYEQAGLDSIYERESQSGSPFALSVKGTPGGVAAVSTVLRVAPR